MKSIELYVHKVICLLKLTDVAFCKHFQPTQLKTDRTLVVKYSDQYSIQGGSRMRNLCFSNLQKCVQLP